VCICGACDCAAGWVEPDCSVQTKSPARVFMAPDGLQQFAAPMGPTTYLTPAGTTVSVLAWMEDVTPTGGPLNAYQLIWSFHAHPLEGASGWVEYVDHDPGQPGGNSLVVDVTRPDWIFADTIQQPVYYNETPGIGIFGVFYATVPFLFVNPAELGDIRYLAEFELQVSPDASGVFEFKFNLFPEPPPLSYLYKPFGGAYPLDEYQPLRLVVGQTQPLTSEPPHQAIDPRQGSADGAEGGATLQLIYNGPAPDVAATDFGVEVSTGDPPQIEDLTADGVTVTLSFDRPFPGGACTTVRHLPSDWRVTIRALPGDVNGDGLTSPGDIITLVDQFNGAKQPPLKTWQCDINLSGECEPRDILALVDLLNGGGIQEAWNGVQAPECP
jgi:hypothetical protein